MVAEIFAGVGALKTAFDIAKGLKDIDDATRRNAAVIELQEKILSAQSAQSDLVERVRDLEKEVAGFETWETEKQRYEMKDFGGGTIAYELKRDMAGGEPPHRICTACYQKRLKGILQPTGVNSYRQQMVKCSECSKDFVLGTRVERNLNARSNTDFDPFTGR
jgi:hypothetical protein